MQNMFSSMFPRNFPLGMKWACSCSGKKRHVSLLMKSVAEAPCCWFCSFLSVVDVVVKRI